MCIRDSPIRTKVAKSLVPTWGDGLGTGTGFTKEVPGLPMSMKLGQWAPHVFKFSSNWKELSTLLLMLTSLTTTEAQLVKETTLFYFTDNSTAYWIVQAGSSPSPGLHKLVEQINQDQGNRAPMPALCCPCPWCCDDHARLRFLEPGYLGYPPIWASDGLKFHLPGV